MRYLKENNYIYYKNFCLKKITTILSNEKVKYYVIVRNYQELYYLIDYLNDRKIKYLIIGNGSKLVFKKNYNGVIISLKELNKIQIKDNLCEVESGTLLLSLINRLKKNNLGGIEELVGIPSSVGGGLINNISAHNTALSDYLIKVYIYLNGKIITLNKEDIEFNYRYSSLKKDGIILKAVFRFKYKSIEEIDHNIKNYLEYRKVHQVIKKPNIGSIFKNNVKTAVEILKECKLENFKYKNISLSKKHINFIAIKGITKGKYIYRFVKKIIKKVKKQLNIDLETEIIFK